MEKKKLWDMPAIVTWAFALVYNNIAMHFVPCMRPGKKVIATANCEWCGAEGQLFVFVSEDKSHYLGICKTCRKHEIKAVKGGPSNPVDAATQGTIQAAQSLRCKALKADGTQCRYMAKHDGYCGVHGGKTKTVDAQSIV